MRFPNPDSAPTPTTVAPVPPAPKPFLSTPGGVALIAGLGVLLVGGVAYAVTRSSGPSSCAWVPVANAYGAFGQPGRYRVDIGLPPALVANFATNYPPTEAQWEQMLQQSASHLPPGVAVEGLWLPAVTVNGQTLGPYSYPPNTPLPSDWPAASDGLTHARMQLLWPFKSDILTGVLSSQAANMLLQKVGVSLQVSSCPTGPIPAAMVIPFKTTPVTPDSSGNVTANPGDVLLISAPPSSGNTVADAVDGFTKVGFLVLASWGETVTPNDWPSSDGGARWRFIVANTSQNPIAIPADPTYKFFALDLASLVG